MPPLIQKTRVNWLIALWLWKLDGDFVGSVCMWVVQLDTCEALLPRSEGCVEEAEVGLHKGSCRLGREDHEQRDGVQETCPGNTQCELPSQAEAVNLSSSTRSGHGESPGCAPGRGGTHGLISSWLRQGRGFDLECQVNVSQVPAAAVGSNSLWHCIPKNQRLCLESMDEREDWLAMPALGVEYGGIVGMPHICWDWAGPSQGYSKERGCQEAIPATEDRFTSIEC